MTKGLFKKINECGSLMYVQLPYIKSIDTLNTDTVLLFTSCDMI